MSLYPEIESYNSGLLKVSDRHQIYFEEVGHPKGEPIVFVHGGPGGGSKINDRRFFDPKHYRIILFDQRGSGRSHPFADLEANTTWDLVSDMEKLREYLGIEAWFVFGGSWGSTLALSYAVSHADRVRGLILRGIFFCSKMEFDWLYQNGTNHVFPEAYQDFIAPIPQNERGDLLQAYHRYLTGDDKEMQQKTAKAWSVWEASTSRLVPNAEVVESYGEDQFALAFARIETHYFVNGGFFETEDELLNKSQQTLQNIPCEIVHGRYDMVCPVENAVRLADRLPKAKLHIMPDAGHSSMEPTISAKLVEITDRFKSLR